MRLQQQQQRANAIAAVGALAWSKVAARSAALLLAGLLLDGLAKPASAAPGGWGTPEEFKNAVNAGYSFHRTNWDAALVNETHPQ